MRHWSTDGIDPDLRDLRCREDVGNLWLVLNGAKDSVHVLQMGIWKKKTF